MKRILVVILCFLYMSSATGATIQLHYCMGNLMDMSIFGQEQDEDECDDCCKNETKDKGCCKDEQKVFKTNEHQLADAAFKLVQQDAAVLPALAWYAHTSAVYNKCSHVTVAAHAPPVLWRAVPIYIQVQNFRI